MRKYAFPIGTKIICIQVKTGDPGFTQCLQGNLRYTLVYQIMNNVSIINSVVV